MWEIDDVVLYRTSGLCRIEKIACESFSGVEEDYYVLRPLFDEKSSVFVPCKNTALCEKMRPLLTQEEAESLILSFPTLTLEWEENDKKRADGFKAVIESGDRRGIAAIIKAVHDRRESLIASGKKSRASDEAIFAKAEKLLYDELSYVLKIEREDVGEYISTKLKENS